MPALE
jgi:hypothetical protein